MCVDALGVVIVSYILGSIPFSYLVGRLGGKNILEEGSRNLGALNVYRTTGNMGLAILALLLDIGKGFAAAYISVLMSPTYAFLSPFFAVVGHNWPIWTRFRGGRGISVMLGESLVFQPTFGFLWAALWVVGYIITGYIAGGAMIAHVLTPPVHATVFGPPYVGLVLAIVPIWMKYVEKMQLLVEGKLRRHFWREHA